MIWVALVLGSVGLGWLLGHGDAATNARAAAASASGLLLTALLGVTAGFYGRDRVRLKKSYASPSRAYGGKVLLFASLAPAAAWVLAPVGWPASCLPLFAAGAAAGLALWLGNLPSRL